ncbi:hypothetical protein BQ8482_180306 [Mesorhizobium delmotii]|uniref:Uncharacterized protein n=1 Tax=Mesorhizobium delmotii TaxID=1631247 RepID=A0A2P9AIX5_9HYPH|nr:hypothetical protein BQ8482_180306 [Mesorhizobium delmotii]
MAAGAVASSGVGPAKAAGWAGIAVGSTASAAIWTGAMPDDSGSTETVSGSASVKPASAPAAVVSVREGTAFVCEVEVQPLRPAAASITPIAGKMIFAGKPRSGPVRLLRKSLHQRLCPGNPPPVGTSNGFWVATPA